MRYDPIEKDGETFLFIQHIDPRNIVDEDPDDMTVTFQLASNPKAGKRYEHALLIKEKHNGWYGLYSSVIPSESHDCEISKYER